MSATVSVRHLRTQIKNALAAAGSPHSSVPVTQFPADESLWGQTHIVLKELSGGLDRRIAHGLSIAVEAVWQVVVVVPGKDLGSAIAVSRIIHPALEGSSGTNPDGQVFWCLRQGPVSLPIKRDGTVYQQLGGIYRLRVKET